MSPSSSMSTAVLSSSSPAYGVTTCATKRKQQARQPGWLARRGYGDAGRGECARLGLQRAELFLERLDVLLVLGDGGLQAPNAARRLLDVAAHLGELRGAGLGRRLHRPHRGDERGVLLLLGDRRARFGERVLLARELFLEDLAPIVVAPLLDVRIDRRERRRRGGRFVQALQRRNGFRRGSRSNGERGRRGNRRDGIELQHRRALHGLVRVGDATVLVDVLVDRRLSPRGAAHRNGEACYPNDLHSALPFAEWEGQDRERSWKKQQDQWDAHDLAQ